MKYIKISSATNKWLLRVVVDYKCLFVHINYPVRVCAAGLSIWFHPYVYLYVYNYVYLCDQKTSVLYLAGRNSLQKPVKCLLLRFICCKDAIDS